MPYITPAKGDQPMPKGNMIFGLIGLVAFYGVVFGALSYSARTNPDRVDAAYSAYGAHSAVIGPYRGD
jgi:hypothetical protein